MAYRIEKARRRRKRFLFGVRARQEWHEVHYLDETVMTREPRREKQAVHQRYLDALDREKPVIRMLPPQVVVPLREVGVPAPGRQGAYVSMRHLQQTFGEEQREL